MPDEYDEHKALRRAVEHAIDYIDSLDQRQVPPSVATADLRKRLGKDLDEEGVSPEQVIDELVADVEGGLFTTGGGRFFGWAIGGVLPAALAADWLTSAWDQNSAIHATSPALAVMEEVTGAWLKDVLRLPRDASFAFVTGCQSAHITALAAARQKRLSERGYDVGARGLSGAPPITIRTGELCHESIARAARLLGLGTDSVVTHPWPTKILPSPCDDPSQPSASKNSIRNVLFGWLARYTSAFVCPPPRLVTERMSG